MPALSLSSRPRWVCGGEGQSGVREVWVWGLFWGPHYLGRGTRAWSSDGTPGHYLVPTLCHHYRLGFWDLQPLCPQWDTAPFSR